MRLALKSVLKHILHIYVRFPYLYEDYFQQYKPDSSKTNETNNLYAEDVEKLRKEVECLSHTLSQFVSTLQWKEV